VQSSPLHQQLELLVFQGSGVSAQPMDVSGSLGGSNSLSASTVVLRVTVGPVGGTRSVIDSGFEITKLSEMTGAGVDW
jgi:hypothetical protein